MKTRAIAALALLLVGALAGCAGGADKAATPVASKAPSATKAPASAQPQVTDEPAPATSKAIPNTTLGATKQACLGGDISDDGKTLQMTTDGKGAKGNATVRQVGCVLSALTAPGNVIDHIFGTTGSDGTQKDAWGNYSASWTYSTEFGLKITFTAK